MAVPAFRVRQAVPGWRARSPHRVAQRREVLARFGPRCFLRPPTGFPVCDRGGVLDCQGALAAYRRARQHGHDDIAARAVHVARAHGCRWAR